VHDGGAHADQAAITYAGAVHHCRVAYRDASTQGARKTFVSVQHDIVLQVGAFAYANWRRIAAHGNTVEGAGTVSQLDIAAQGGGRGYENVLADLRGRAVNGND